MPIVQAGKTFTAAELKEMAGALASFIRDHTQSGMDLGAQLQSWPDADLLALGLSQDEVNAIKGFYVGDLPAIAQLLDQSSWIRQLIGLGV